MCSDTRSCLTLSNPMDCSLPGSSVHGILQNTGVGCHFRLQGICPTQGLNQSVLRLLHWQADSLPLEPPSLWPCKDHSTQTHTIYLWDWTFLGKGKATRNEVSTEVPMGEQRKDNENKDGFLCPGSRHPCTFQGPAMASLLRPPGLQSCSLAFSTQQPERSCWNTYWFMASKSGCLTIADLQGPSLADLAPAHLLLFLHEPPSVSLTNSFPPQVFALPYALPRSSHACPLSVTADLVQISFLSSTI